MYTLYLMTKEEANFPKKKKTIFEKKQKNISIPEN